MRISKISIAMSTPFPIPFQPGLFNTQSVLSKNARV
jgi:hypothetical protein